MIIRDLLASLQEGLPPRHYRVAMDQGWNFGSVPKVVNLDWRDKSGGGMIIDPESYSWPHKYWMDRPTDAEIDYSLKERIFYVLSDPKPPGLPFPEAHDYLNKTPVQILEMPECIGYRPATWREFMQFLLAIRKLGDLGPAFLLTAFGSIYVAPHAEGIETFEDSGYLLNPGKDPVPCVLEYAAPTIGHEGSGCCFFTSQSVLQPVKRCLLIKLEGKELAVTKK